MPEKNARKEREKEKWIEIIVSAPPELIEALSNFLTEAGAKGVFQEDTFDESSPNDLDEPAVREDLKAYIASGPAGDKKIAALGKYLDSLSEIFPNLEKPSFRTRLIEEADWGEQWKKYFKPLRLSKNIVIKPTWERYTPQHRDIVVEIDPGMAFGTGQHPSTRMCLEAIEDILLKDRSIRKWRVLDVGTGTGILGISCAKLGAESVVGADIDPKAVEIARKNVTINGVEDRVRIVNRDVRKMKGAFDLIVANLTAETLLKLKSHLISLTDPGRYLVISGIIEQNGRAVEEAFSTENMSLLKTIREKEWLCCILKKGDQA
jgi:ribosomal protein L11 methyltransferase